MKKAKILTKYEIAAMIGWYRQSGDYAIVGVLAGVSTSDARVIVENYLKKKWSGRNPTPH
jgi:hypothetical protein